jgi:hypothetical protein
MTRHSERDTSIAAPSVPFDTKGTIFAVPASASEDARNQLAATILSSKTEILQLESDLSDSLSKSHLAPGRRSLFAHTITQLEASSDILNKQLEQLLVEDLERNRLKLTDILEKMKGSERELQAMIARLDKITGYLQIATNLIQSLAPIKPVVTKPATRSK